jgi:DNA-directed RNA polymerase specialized sigma subunit
MSDNPNRFDDSFYRLANSVAVALDVNKVPVGDSKRLLELQKKQVETLMKLESQFKASILKYSQAREIYKKFILMIVVQNQNILSARPFFREKAGTFSKKITPAIRDANVEALQKFNVNFKFIMFVKEAWLGAMPKKSLALYNRIEIARRELIENNLPLAINEAKKFYNKVPNNHVTLMDLIAAAAEGLASGVDKWCGPYTKIFRSVCIGRMKGNMIDLYSETTIHFYPTEKRILYKANTIRFREGADTLAELAEAINKSFEEDEKEGKKGSKARVTEGLLSNLLNAASTFSADSKPDSAEGEEQSILDLAPDDSNFEDDMIRNDALAKARQVAEGMDLVTRKILIMKGLEV